MRDENYKKRLQEYFKKNLAKGYSADTLKWALIKQGNSRSAVEIASDDAQKEVAAEAAKVVEPKIEYLHVEDIQQLEQQQPKKSWWKRMFGK
ncbi:MAG: hypothetical protein Q7S06_02215 [Nanoarchaeota archaeon]|nr:hypothetical protein [Nanoarchaeota archaeon]